MAIFKDFLGLNYCIYEPTMDDFGAEGGNTLGYRLESVYGYSDEFGSPNLNIGPFSIHAPERTMVLLNLHRNGPHGYPTWKQVRASQNHLTRAQRKKNIFTYVQEPGQSISSKPSKYGEIRSFTEPVVTDSYKPLTLQGEMSIFNDRVGQCQDVSVELKTSFGNETAFFAHEEVNNYYDTLMLTDENYEQLKELYLDGGLEDDGSPLESFNLLIYKQTVFPKQQYAYLDRTRARTGFVNEFWRSDRENRTQTSQQNGFGFQVPSQSMWPLDVPSNWATANPAPAVAQTSYVGSARTLYLYSLGAVSGSRFTLAAENAGGFNTGDDTVDPAIFGLTSIPNQSDGGSGILLNTYSHLARGFFTDSDGGYPDFMGGPGVEFEDCLKSAPFYSRKNTFNRLESLYSPSGLIPKEIKEYQDTYSGFGGGNRIIDGLLFLGEAAWDCARLAGKEPFYDSYEKFAYDTRLKGKGYSIIPEFRISSHVRRYLTMGVTEELREIFEIQGAFEPRRTSTKDPTLVMNESTRTQADFYKILSTTDFLKHFDLVKKDHKDSSRESVLTLRCKAIKKFLPYEGFYPAQQTVEIAEEFASSIFPNVTIKDGSDQISRASVTRIQGMLEPLFAPGVLFNTIKSGVAVDYPIVLPTDNPTYINVDYQGFTISNEKDDEYREKRYNYQLAGSDFFPFLEDGYDKTQFNLQSVFSKRVAFESLVEPEKFLANLEISIQEPHPFGLRDTFGIKYNWDGNQRPTYKKKINNFLAEVADLFLQDSSFSTISSAEESSPSFGNAVAGKYYTMRVKMSRTRRNSSHGYESYRSASVNPPQDLYHQGSKSNLTMFSRPSSFGIGVWGTNLYGDNANPSGAGTKPLDSLWGNNYCFTPPYYYGEAWCDLIFYAEETRKYSLEEIMSGSAEFPYYTRFWHPAIQDTIRDLNGYVHVDDNGDTSLITFEGKYKKYASSPWRDLFKESSLAARLRQPEQHPYTINPSSTIFNDWSSVDDLYVDTGGISDPDSPRWRSPIVDYRYFDGTNPFNDDGIVAPPHHPAMVNYNAMQLDSSVNLFGKGLVREKRNLETGETIEVASDQTVRGKTRWIIQTKFETPILNFHQYSDLSQENLTKPDFGAESVPRGMWHQYGRLPADDEGVFLQVTDIPESWFLGALNLKTEDYRDKVESLADLVGFSKDPVRLGEVADVKEISEAVVAVPFIEKDGKRQFFAIPRVDIDSCIDAIRREVEPGRFVAGGPPKAGDSVYQMVKNMKKYVFPPSMDFVKYDQIDPFAMYIFEFKHNLSRQDLADIWQNLPPEIGTRMEEAEASVSHELLAHELLGGGAEVKNGTLDENAKGNGLPSNIQWMVFKAKRRAKTNYFDKVVAKKGTTADTSGVELENAEVTTGDDLGVTYNWPYDYFSLVELIKLDAEVAFANIENDDKGKRVIRKVNKKSQAQLDESCKKSDVNTATGRGRPE